VLIAILGIFANNLGDLVRAREALRHSLDLTRCASEPEDESMCVKNIAWLEENAGRFPEALGCSESAVSLGNESEDKERTTDSLTLRAAAHFALGDIAAAVGDFQRATGLEGNSLIRFSGLQEAECKLLRGDKFGALSQTQANREVMAAREWNNVLCRCNALIARVLLPDDPAQASRYLQDARAFANRSGEVELQLRCFHAACELQRHLGNYPQAIAEADAGLLLADTCGFGKYSIDIRLALAETYLQAGDARKALQNAREALDRSEHPDCQYAWGQADGLHFCGLAHLRLGERELARQRLTAALEIRERLGHGRIEETRRALEQL
jgi:tetratricopeptide (TPR) repeat protein